MRNYFTLNGVDSRDFGVYINGQGTYSAPEKDYTFYQIPGRSGDIIGSENRLMNIEITYHAFIYADFDNNMAAFRSFLLSLDGYQRLEDSYHPDEFRMACYTGPFDPAVTVVNDAGEFDVVFNCKPQRYLKSGETEYSFVANASDIPVEGKSLRLFGDSLDRSEFKMEWPFSQLGSGSPSSDNIRPILKADRIIAYINNENYYNQPAPENAAGMTVDLVAGTYEVTHKVKTLSSAGWSSSIPGAFQISDSEVTGAADIATSGVCSHYPTVSTWPGYNKIGIQFDHANGKIIIYDYRFYTLPEFQRFIGQNGVTVGYPLASPITGTVATASALPNGWFTISSFSKWVFKMAMKPTPDLTNPTIFPSQPLIRIFGAGTFTLNDITVTVSQADEFTDVDCELMDCYKGNVNKNQYVSFSTYDFPVLKSGQNTVGFAGGVTAVTIIPRWWRV